MIAVFVTGTWLRHKFENFAQESEKKLCRNQRVLKITVTGALKLDFRGVESRDLFYLVFSHMCLYSYEILI